MANDSKPIGAEGAEKGDGIVQIDNWSNWHNEYENENSELNARKRAVQAEVFALAAKCQPGPITIISICGGQGREVIGALEHHPRRADVRGRIVELDEDNAAFARSTARKAGIGIEVFAGDASLAASYAGLPPADIVVISGVFGHLSNSDRVSLISFVRQIVKTGASVVYTFFRWDEEQVQQLRSYFSDQQFEEGAFETLDGKYKFIIARAQYSGAPLPFDAGAKVFNFGSSREGRQQAS
jgi:hypothetical protein